MISQIIYVFFIFVLLIFLIYASFYTISLIYSFLLGSPFVKTKRKSIIKIFDNIDISKNTVILDLGCGDGVLLRYASKKYGCKGIGVDVNPILILRARIMSYYDNVFNNISFKIQKIKDADVGQADVVYSFLLPILTNSIKDKLLKELKPGAIYVSHGFKIKFFSEWLVKEIPDNKFPTYIYQKPNLLPTPKVDKLSLSNV